jgi:hypothetical protein
MKKILFVLFLSTLLIMGCSGSRDSGNSDTTPFIGGTSSVDVMFEEGAPPAEVYAGQQYPFDIIVNLDNSGEYDIAKEDIKVKIVGLEPSLFGFTELEKNPIDDLPGTRKDSEGNVIDGAMSTVEFTNLNYQEDLDATIDGLPIKADVCYKYGTKARAKVCVKQDVLDKKKSDICVINEEKTVFNSAGPIQISSLQETAQGTNKLAFSFTVSHVGVGSTYSMGSGCPNERGDENKVWINIDAGLEGLVCSGITPDAGSTTAGVVNLGATGERTVRCTLDVSNVATDFEKSVSFEMVYDYKKDVSTSLTIRPNLN